jgi:hypothetical protein
MNDGYRGNQLKELRELFEIILGGRAALKLGAGYSLIFLVMTRNI